MKPEVWALHAPSNSQYNQNNSFQNGVFMSSQCTFLDIYFHGALTSLHREQMCFLFSCSIQICFLFYLSYSKDRDSLVLLGFKMTWWKEKKMNTENHNALHFLMQLSLSNRAAEWYGERKSRNLWEIFHWVRKGFEAGIERCVAGTVAEHLWCRANQLGSKVSKRGGSQRCARWDLGTISQIISSPIISQILKLVTDIQTIVLIIHPHDCLSPSLNNSEHWSSGVGHWPM